MTAAGLDELQRTPAAHFRLHVYAAILRLRAQLPEPDDDNGLAFLRGYYAQLESAAFDASGEQADERMAVVIESWEAQAHEHLPLRALRETCALDTAAMALLFVAGLLEEDARFGPVFEVLNGLHGELRPTAGTLSSWGSGDDARRQVGALLAAGLLTGGQPGTPRSSWALQVPDVLWDAMRGDAPPAAPAPWARYRPPDQLDAMHDLILETQTARSLARLPVMLDATRQTPVVVRGPNGSGRGAVLGALARGLGRGILELTADAPPSLAGPLSTLLHALPVVALEPAPGQTADVPRLGGYAGPVGVVLGRRGAVRAPERGLTLELGVPDIASRAAHWSQCAGDGHDPFELAERFRIPGGTIRCAAQLARTVAALQGRTTTTDADIRSAMRILHGEALDTLATRMPASGGWEDLAVGEQTARELELLESRCRHRERLHETVGAAFAAQLTPGVRSLLSGPSGTGKTLAARLLASVLGKELYALDLSSVVSKYIGETEKNLEAVFSRAEELDVVLLLDEGDALLTRRTDVQSSNDRYANLETNFLLQRLECYEGILLVTTNAGDRIDDAFRRRMDVVVDFRAPDAAERWTIWQLHLAGNHALDDAFLDELAGRCQMTGGQIRNAVLHAALLALDEGVPVGPLHAELAVRREYRKAGAVCPLRAPAVARG